MGIKIGNLDISFKVGSGDCTVYLGSEKLYPQEPTFDGKFQAWYSDSTTYSAACDSSSALTTADTKTYSTAYSAMTSAIIGDCVTSIGNQTFWNCTSLTSIVIPNSVTSIGTYAFYYCTSLTSIDIPSGLTSISDNAFYQCSSLTSITIPNSVTSIGGGAFQDCYGLTSINLPSGVTSIGNMTFYGCTNLTSVTVNALTPPSLGEHAFNNTNNCPIYVPCDSVNAYKTAWSGYASRIDCVQPTPTAQTPCYAVVDNISQYSDTDFEDVYNNADDKWYKLNNLTQYEEYGIYASGRTECGSTPSRLPSGYTEVEYVENTSVSCVDTGFKPNQDTRIMLSAQTVTSQSSGKLIGSGGFNRTNAMQFCYEPSSTGSLMVSWGTVNGWTEYSSCVGDYNVHTYDWNKNEFYRDETLVGSVTYANFQCTDNLGIFRHIQAGDSPSSAAYFLGKVFAVKIYDNGTLVRDLVPAKRDSDLEYGFYDLVGNEFYASFTSASLGGGSAVTPSRLPSGYTEVEHIENTGTSTSNGAYINTGVLLYDNANNTFTITSRLKSQYYTASGDNTLQTIINSEGVSSPYNGFTYRYKYNTSGQQLELAGNNNNASLTTVDNEDGTRTITIQTVSAATFTEQVPLSIFSSFNGNYSTPYRFSKTTLYSMTVVKNGTTIRDFVPAQRDSDSRYGLYDLITSTFYVSPNGNNFVGGSAVTPSQECVTTYDGKLTIDDDYEYQYSGGTWNNVGEVSGGVEYPMYYPIKQDPPTSVTFATMEEALQYQCPYVGLHATIDGEEYVFNEQYQWELATPSSKKIQLTYSDLSTYDIDCDTATTLTQSDVQGGSGSYTAITSAEIGDCVTSIGDDAFHFCLSLTNINIPNSVTSIGKQAFSQCSGLTSIDLPSGLTSIGENAFSRCGLTSIDIPSGVTRIDFAFGGCSSLTSVTLPNSVTNIGGYTFQNCTSLTSIDIPSCVTSIGSSAFYGCSSLTSIDIPNSVTSIGYMAFYGCNSLTSVTIGNGVTSIDSQAFQNCTSLTSIVFESTTPPTLGTEVFNNTNNCPIYVPCESLGAYIAASGWSEYADRIMTLSPSFFYRWVETQDTVCENGNLCAVEQYEWSCDGENYSASTLTRASRVIESGSTSCPQATILDAYELVSLSGNGTTSKTFTDGGVDFSSTQNWKLTGTTQGGSTASRITGKTDCTIALSSGGDINNIAFICYNRSTKDRIVQWLISIDGTVTNGATTLDGTARYYVRVDFNTPQSSVKWQNGSQALNINMIGVNVPQGWETSLDE